MLTTKPEQVIIVTSDSSGIGGNPADLIARYTPPLKLSEGKIHVIELISCKIPLTVYNITPTIANNTFRYSTDSASTWETVTIGGTGGGVFSLDTIYNEIKAALITNGDYQVSAGGAIEYPFTIGGNSARSKGFVQFLSTYTTTAYTDLQVDLTNNGSSTFYSLYGFVATNALFSATSATEFLSDKNVDIMDGEYRIRLPGFIHGALDSRFDDILLVDTLQGDANGYYFPTLNHDKICGIIRDGIINIYEFKIRLEDRNGNLLVFSDDSIEKNTYFQFVIY